MPPYAPILSYWFGESEDPFTAPSDRLKLWFSASPDTDAYMREHFEQDVLAAAAGRLDEWRQTPQGWIALILLLDQCPRNIYRNSPKAFSFDEFAQSLALNALHAGIDQQLRPIERVFAYLPLEHAEDLSIQHRSVACFQALADASPPAHRDLYESYLSYARRHLVVIEQFQRFPHRNAILGRPSTEAELAFLASPKAPF